MTKKKRIIRMARRLRKITKEKTGVKLSLVESITLVKMWQKGIIDSFKLAEMRAYHIFYNPKWTPEGWEEETSRVGREIRKELGL